MGATFTQVFKEAGVPYYNQGGKFYSSVEIEDVLAFLRITINPADDRAFFRVAKVLGTKLAPETVARLRATQVPQSHAPGGAVGRGDGLLLAARRYVREQQTSGKKRSGTKAKRKKSDDKRKRKEQGQGQEEEEHALPRAQLNALQKIVDLQESLVDRMEELSLPAFVRRVIDNHPWVRKRMIHHKHQTAAQPTGASSSSRARDTSTADAAAADLGAALLYEAEHFNFHSQPQAPLHAGARGPGLGPPGRGAALDVPGFSGGALDNGGDDGDADGDNQSGSPASTTPNAKRLKRFLDHLSETVEEERSMLIEQHAKNDKRPARDAVWLGTVHQAKGLEWPIVFVVRFNEEEFPLNTRFDETEAHFRAPGMSESLQDRNFQEEERRLAYVALSRPKRCLCLRDRKSVV